MTSTNLSFWADAYGPYTANEPLRGERRVDVVVVGGGFNGLSTAYHLRTEGEALDVVLLEADAIGDGSSGRNAGAAVVGVNGVVLKAHGEQRTKELYDYASRALDYMRELITKHDMQSDVIDTGSLTVAIGDRWVKDLEAAKAMHESFDPTHDVEWVDAATLAQEFNSPLFAGAAGLREKRTFMFDPVKHVREWKRLATEAGVEVYEHSPAIEIVTNPREVRVTTPRGTVVANRLVLATNAYSHKLPSDVLPVGDQTPLYSYQFATEPLSPEQWDSIGFKNRNWTEDSLSLFHWARPTVDGRLIFGGRDGLKAADDGLTREYDVRVFHRMERDFRAFFPQLSDVRVTHRWGGVISGTFDLLPHIGFVDERKQILRVNGCWGHGVAIAHLHGKLLAHLARGVDSELTNLWIVDRKTKTWPPGPMRTTAARAAFEGLRALENRTIRRSAREAVRPDQKRAFAQLQAPIR
ncbi:FAD-binding oxidoreductase [Nocardioides sp. CER19]|uniref:NAD(P)/FAD-dependent oxidoreductase n=1 Tax=Nocardioides sp. CER19 TaxID=3038538 RepID=UPI002448A3E1|nr:FAD-binding oxidoreductase [Nocardioides sp. CER19]MDH2416159.1 FAD-binding oxidoreductase [Nocardioides sp. CER19]